MPPQPARNLPAGSCAQRILRDTGVRRISLTATARSKLKPNRRSTAMKTTGQPQLMNTEDQINLKLIKERNMKARFSLYCGGCRYSWQGGVFLSGDNLGEERKGRHFYFCAPDFHRLRPLVAEELVGNHPGRRLCSLGLVVVLVSLIPREDYPRLPTRLAGAFTPGCCSWGLPLRSGCSGCCARANPPAGRYTPAFGLLTLAVATFILGQPFSGSLASLPCYP